MLGDEQVHAFAERGFVLVPQVVPPDLLAAANHRIDQIVAADLPAPETRGNHFYFLETKDETALAAPLTGSPAFALAEQVKGRAGDVLLAHYLLGHNIGGNFTSALTRRALYLRLSAHGHAAHREQFLQDPWCDYAPQTPAG